MIIYLFIYHYLSDVAFKRLWNSSNKQKPYTIKILKAETYHKWYKKGLSSFFVIFQHSKLTLYFKGIFITAIPFTHFYFFEKNNGCRNIKINLQKCFNRKFKSTCQQNGFWSRKNLFLVAAVSPQRSYSLGPPRAP